MANSIALMAPAVEPLPLASRTFAPMMLASQLTPTTPTALLPVAPIVPDVCDPWLLSSSGLHVLLMALKPCVPAAHVIKSPPTFTVNAAGADQTLAVRSGWL